MSKIKCAVIGVGYLGRFHAQKYIDLPNAELVAVCDVNSDICQAVAKELNVPAILNYRELFGQVDAVSIATTTREHFRVAQDCLAAGLHVLLEKPMTETVQQARTLIELAARQRVKFQVGHLERFNAAHTALLEHVRKPLFIESQRLAPFNLRGADVNVVLDIMIHDIDLIQSLVASPIISIEAQGAPVLTSSIDIANARLTFANRCVANITASRVSFKTERKMRVFQENTYISVDYHNKQFSVFQRGEGEIFPGIPNIAQQQYSFEKEDALLKEIQAFLYCIEHNLEASVSGEAGCAALETSIKISSIIQKNLELHQASNELSAVVE